MARTKLQHQAPRSEAAAAAEDPDEPRHGRRDVALCHLVLNGDPITVAAPAHWTLLEVLRYALDLTGTKQGCDKGDCGACTVRVNGRPTLACLTLAQAVHGATVDTVEGLGVGGRPHPLQAAFDQAGAAQCGFCTPGMLMSAAALLEGAPPSGDGPKDRRAIAAALGGNLCRCTGYTKIIDAVQAAWLAKIEEPAHG